MMSAVISSESSPISRDASTVTDPSRYDETPVTVRTPPSTDATARSTAPNRPMYTTGRGSSGRRARVATARNVSAHANAISARARTRDEPITVAA